ncbi:unnamed protein product [Somion occarium]|uniref:Zn(2)-C6 fungal-type domain-containing protein n=1 Tax=Somion occarium TaxID=3059160 RepID=A0ABP1DI50_9APHY
MAAAAKPKPVSRRSSKTTVNSANHTSSSQIRSSAAFRTASEPFYSLDTSVDGSGSKKRKVERACDFCRRRKTKCDGPKMEGYKCTNCIQNGRECTYVEVSKPRGPPKAYIQSLEDRIEKMEAVLRRLRPEADFTPEIGPPIPRDSWKSESPAMQSSLSRQTTSSSQSQGSSLVPPQPSLAVSGGSGVSHAAPYPGSGPIMIALTHATSRDNVRGSGASSEDDEPSSASSSDSEDYGELSLVRGMQSLSLKPLESHDNRTVPDSQWRFHGKSSSFKLINTARKLQNEASKVAGESTHDDNPHQIGAHRRPYFWNSPQYEATLSLSDSATRDLLRRRFPPPELARSLSDYYFNMMNAHFPLLHRPTFDKQLENGLHERDIWFGCLCMSVFGVGARWSKDLGVLWDDDKGLSEAPDPTSPLWGSAGWKYIHVALEIHRTHSEVILPACLFEIQSYHLLGLFLRSSSFYSDAWKIVSLGLRKAQDVGAHRKKVYGRTRTIEDELWKRAYWNLVTFDHIGSMINGRSCASRDEDSDLEMPLQVDDEYWENEDPALAFRQPPDKPCITAFFNCWIKLTQIAAFALRTLYALGKSKAPLGLVGNRWREDTLTRLNEALTTWVDELPNHLRWSPNMDHPLFASQATTLVTTYYMVTIVVHRPFIPMPLATHDLAAFQSQQRHNLVDRPDFPWTCLSICTNAAKATAAIWETNTKLRRMINMTSLANSCYISAGVLLVHIWLVRAIQKAEGPRMSDERRQVFTSRMNDLMDNLSKLMARLEEISSSFEIARQWLKEIKDSLPPEDASPHDASFSHQADLHTSDGQDRTSHMDTQYDFARPDTFDDSIFSLNIPPSSMSAPYANPEEEVAYAVSDTNSLVASAPIPSDTSSSLANALYPFNPAQSWESSRPASSQAQRFSQSYQPTSRAIIRRASLAPTGAIHPEGISPLRHYRSSSDLGSFSESRRPYTADSTLVMDQQSSTPHFGNMPQPPYILYQQIRQSEEALAPSAFPLKRERSDSGHLREIFSQTPMVSPAMARTRLPTSPMLHTSRSQGNLQQAWGGGSLSQNMRVYRGERSWREYASHVDKPRRNSSFSPHTVARVGPSGLSGVVTSPEELLTVGYGTLYTAVENKEAQNLGYRGAPSY